MRRYELKIANIDLTEFSDFRDAVINIQEDEDTKTLNFSINDIVLIDKHNKNIINYLLQNIRSTHKANITIDNHVLEGYIDLSECRFFEVNDEVKKAIISITLDMRGYIEILLKSMYIDKNIFIKDRVRVGPADPNSFIFLFISVMMALVLHIVSFIHLYLTQRATTLAIAATAAPGSPVAAAGHEAAIRVIRTIHLIIMIAQLVIFLTTMRNNLKACEDVVHFNIINALQTALLSKGIRLDFNFDFVELQKLHLMLFGKDAESYKFSAYDLLMLIKKLTNSKIYLSNNAIILTKKYESYKDNNIIRSLFDEALRSEYEYNISDVVGRHIIRFDNNNYNSYYLRLDKDMIEKEIEQVEFVYSCNNTSFRKINDVNVGVAIASDYKPNIDPFTYLTSFLGVMTGGIYLILRGIVNLFRKRRCDDRFLLPNAFKSFIFVSEKQNGVTYAESIINIVKKYYTEINTEKIMKVYKNVKIKLNLDDFISMKNAGFTGIKKMQYFIEKNYAICDIYDYTNLLKVDVNVFHH